MRRRNLIKGALAGLGGASLGFRLPLANAADYRGRLFVFVQADGGWDPTSFCDPKANTPGEPVINHWAERDEIRTAGRIAYAPFANNARFFTKYHRRMLVINGVDAQTNSHTVGIVHNWSGRNSEGYPSMGALLSAHYGPELPVTYLNFGGYAETGGVARYTRINNADRLRNIAAPELVPREPWHNSQRRYISDADWSALRSRQTSETARLVAARNVLPGDLWNRRLYQSSFLSAEGLKAYADAIPPEDELERTVQYETPAGNRYWSELRRQAQLAVLAFKTGVSVSADLWLGGFDTHSTHDPDHEWLLGNLADGVDFLWDYAEEHGVADRMLVVIGSDFARTNFYNSQDGKDHWPIGSYVVMEKNQPWTSRAVGETDGLHFAQKINPRTLERDDANGTIIYPKHVHKALRRYLGIENSPGARRFPFSNTEDFAFFG
ncbi:MAG: DUF1501 domain-containing protein [Gammaproteobacteria bacterium]|nr:DUF1501 domain-containing protein [Gammaproteobacteria bacterium]